MSSRTWTWAELGEWIAPRLGDVVDRSLLDWAVAAGLVVLTVVEGSARPSAVDVLAVLAAAAVAWRRAAPVPVFTLVALAALVGTTTPFSTVATVVVAAYAVGVYSRHRNAALLVVLVLTVALVARYPETLIPLPGVLGPFVLLVVPWLVGNTLRSQQLTGTAHRERADRLEREQEQATQVALAEERRRIARELHDVVAHGVSVMVVQAGAARSVMGSAPEQATEALLAVEATGREALTELRRLVGVLSDDDAGLALAPQPGLDQLGRWSRGCGTPDSRLSCRLPDRRGRCRRGSI